MSTPRKRNMFLMLVRNQPGISATSSVLVSHLPGFSSKYRKPANEVWEILQYLKDKELIEERNGRLYPLGRIFV